MTEYESLVPEATSELELAPAAEELLEWDGKLYPIVRVSDMSEQAYVDMEVLATRLQHLKDPDGRREERCADYARWRYRGWQVGEVKSL
jgi:hypothetical protein